VGFAGERVQVLSLQTVERRESPEYCEIERSFIHRTIRRHLWFQPYDFGCESYHMRQQIRPRWVTSSDGLAGKPLPTGIRPEALAIALREILQPCGDVGDASRPGILQWAAPKRREPSRKYGAGVQ